MKSLAGEDIKVYSAWVPILASDAELTVGRATKVLPDSRVMHYGDGNGELVKGFTPVLGLGDRPAWDVYLLYKKKRRMDRRTAETRFLAGTARDLR